MENRRPPRSNSSGRKPYFDRGRGAPSYRGGSSGSGSGGRFGGDGRTNPQRRSEGSSDNRGNDRNRRGFDPQRADRPHGNDYKKTDGRGGYGQRRYGAKPGGDRRRPNQTKRPQPEASIKITSDAQITDGKFRGRTLLNSDSPSNTPTPRKVRDITFKVISRRIKARRILDLGAGAGTIGIEAISRGAMLATFVERSARCCSFIRKNLEAFAIKDGHGEVIEMEILPFLKKSAKRRRVWDLVYFDLPDAAVRSEVLEQLSRGSVLTKGGLLLIEHPSNAPRPENINQLKSWRTVDQGETIVSIYERI